MGACVYVGLLQEFPKRIFSILTAVAAAESVEGVCLLSKLSKLSKPEQTLSKNQNLDEQTLSKPKSGRTLGVKYFSQLLVN